MDTVHILYPLSNEAKKDETVPIFEEWKWKYLTSRRIGIGMKDVELEKTVLMQAEEFTAYFPTVTILIPIIINI